jgi:hypothetical protein
VQGGTKMNTQGKFENELTEMINQVQRVGINNGKRGGESEDEEMTQRDGPNQEGTKNTDTNDNTES